MIRMHAVLATAAVVLATNLFAGNASADTSEPTQPSNAGSSATATGSARDSKQTSSVEAAQKRGETVVVNLKATSDQDATKKTTSSTIMMANFPTVANTKAASNMTAGEQAEVNAPKVDSAKASTEPAPAVARAMASLNSRFHQCVAKPKGEILLSVSVSQVGQLAAKLVSGNVTADEATCMTNLVQATKLRGARGTVSTIRVSL